MPVKIPPNIGMSGKRKGSVVPVTPNKDSPSEEKTKPKKFNHPSECRGRKPGKETYQSC
ncbi:MAG: hypothetical protein ACJZ44_00620 [Nitrospinales bacterium]